MGRNLKSQNKCDFLTLSEHLHNGHNALHRNICKNNFVQFYRVDGQTLNQIGGHEQAIYSRKVEAHEDLEKKFQKLKTWQTITQLPEEEQLH